MKSFRFRYPTIVFVLLVVVILASLAGIVWNVYNFIAFFQFNVVKGIMYAVVVLLTTLLLVISVSMTFYGRYVIKNNKLFACFGVIKSVYNLDDAIEITLFKKSNKLVLYFKDATYTVVVIDPADYDEFVIAVREVNPQIIFDKKIEGEDLPNG